MPRQQLACYGRICHNVPAFPPEENSRVMHSELNRTSIATLVDDFDTDIRRDAMI